MSTGPDLLTISRAALAASAVAPEDVVAAYYLAVARVTATKLADELHALELLIAAREGELEPVLVSHAKARSHGELVEDFAMVISDVEAAGEPKVPGAGTAARAVGTGLASADSSPSNARSSSLGSP